MERKTGLEPATPTLARLCSTTELLPHDDFLIISHRDRYVNAVFRRAVVPVTVFNYNTMTYEICQEKKLPAAYAAGNFFL